MRNWWQQYKTYNAFARRVAIIGFTALVLSGICVADLIGMQLLNGSAMAQEARNNRELTSIIPAKRGKITDVNGTVLAQDVERYTVIADPQTAQAYKPVNCASTPITSCQSSPAVRGVKGAAAVARLVAPILKANAMELGAQLSVPGRYAVLKKDITPQMKRELDALHLPGIIYCQLTTQRVYTNGDVMGALLGGVDDRDVGVAGIERATNASLAGVSGKKVFQQGNGGEEIPGTVTQLKNAVNGADVKLTLDNDVQWYVKKVLKDGKDHFHAGWALAVVQDARTGEIVAMEDSDEVKAGTSQAKLTTSRAVSQTFEPGSIGKVFSIAGMLQTGVHRLTDQFVVPDAITFQGQKYKDATNHGAEHWTLTGILEESSNVGMVMASQRYKAEQRYAFLTKFGIGEPSGLKLPGESVGMLAPPSVWDGRTRNTVLFGQGYATNAIQLTNAIATIANRGVRPSQSIIRSITDAAGHVSTPRGAEPVRVIDEQVAAQVLNAMETSGEHYKKFAGVEGYRIAAKSGTAEVAGADGRLSSIISDWSGIIPADHPRFVITVVLKDPQGSYGGLTAGPLFKQIAEFLMQKYEVPTSAPRTDAIANKW